ncbi:hypothetical protein HDV00_003575 [Rhizophlyctis rosea]|nr:hypothetical protein HDV00_003575 [Rhizophlyctis rosea]
MEPVSIVASSVNHTTASNFKAILAISTSNAARLLPINRTQPNTVPRESLIRLNVGVRTFQTTYATLNTHPSSLLARTFDPSNPQMIDIDADGSAFLDRNPDLFASILEFYRMGQLDVRDGTSREALVKKLDFYGLTEAVEKSGAFKIQPSPESTSRIQTLNKFRTNYIGYIQFLALRAAPVLQEAIANSFSTFTIHITPSATSPDVPLALQRTTSHHQFWQDFAFSLVMWSGIINVQEFVKIFKNSINNQKLLRVVQMGANAVVSATPVEVRISHGEAFETKALGDWDFEGSSTKIQAHVGWKLTWSISS